MSRKREEEVHGGAMVIIGKSGYQDIETDFSDL